MAEVTSIDIATTLPEAAASPSPAVGSGPGRDRTDDTRGVNAVLCQLSYRPLARTRDDRVDASRRGKVCQTEAVVPRSSAMAVR